MMPCLCPGLSILCFFVFTHVFLVFLIYIYIHIYIYIKIYLFIYLLIYLFIVLCSGESILHGSGIGEDENMYILNGLDFPYKFAYILRAK